MIHKPSLMSCEVPQKFEPDRFSRFNIYWIHTNKQTYRQTDKQSIYVDTYIYIYIFIYIYNISVFKLHIFFKQKLYYFYINDLIGISFLCFVCFLTKYKFLLLHIFYIIFIDFCLNKIWSFLKTGNRPKKWGNWPKKWGNRPKKRGN